MAVIMWSDCTLCYNDKAVFGPGTRLTVLDPNIEPTDPNVTIIKPVVREKCRKKKVTLVCQATDFYPDHVEVTWKVDDKPRTDGVATDNAATKDEKTKKYSITSRLSIPYKEWIMKSTFDCFVKYAKHYNTTHVSYEVFQATAEGDERADGHENTEANKTITKPKVRVLPPSPKELCNNTATLVCLADGFYPDHINISWQKNGKNITHGVATDHAARLQPNTTFYRISSRLRINKADWKDHKNRFTCTVRFFNGTEYIEQRYIVKKPKASLPVAKLNTVRLGYCSFLIKSLMYALFIAALVWKCKHIITPNIKTMNISSLCKENQISPKWQLQKKGQKSHLVSRKTMKFYG
ncbi:hypothetical protein NFI96_000499 [Prochilodus magdalenae]|nr:hypothetical protein NFI96_000499 [Prochilodus magdalenae]